MADITRLGEIAMPKLSDNMAPEDRRSICFRMDLNEMEPASLIQEKDGTSILIPRVRKHSNGKTQKPIRTKCE